MYEIHKARVNIKSLAAEAAFIRQEIKKTNCLRAKACLHAHRVEVVRPEARLSHLALAYLKGKPRSVAETSHKTEISAKKLLDKLKRWGMMDLTIQMVEDWLKT